MVLSAGAFEAMMPTMDGHEAMIGVGIVLGWDSGKVVVDELASGWPAALTYKIAIGDEILAGPLR